MHDIKENDENKSEYNSQIIESIIELNRADDFIIVMSAFIKRMAIDHLHIVGDIFDRGPGAPIIMDKIMGFHSLDIEWGNHDILWMGAACGSLGCIVNTVRICSRYENFSTLEDDYGINTRPLSNFAMTFYKDDDCRMFFPKNTCESEYNNTNKIIAAKIHKAITVIQFKIEGQIIKYMPYDERLYVDEIKTYDGSVSINDKNNSPNSLYKYK